VLRRAPGQPQRWASPKIDMNTLETIIALVFLPSSIVAGVIFVLRKFFEQALSRDIERFKATLHIELEQSKLRLQNELQTEYFKFQTKFSSYHQKQSEIIGELYGRLNEAEWVVEELVKRPSGGGRPITERISEADSKCVELSRFFSKNRIYLEDDVCQKIDIIIKAMRTAIVKFNVSQMNITGNPSLDIWLEAWKVIEEELPPIKKTLETQFRKSLSAVT
jgi:hypothetical protein